jgi:hypothetical protein
MSAMVPDPDSSEPQTAVSDSEQKKVRKSAPRKPARTPESALPPKQAIRTKTEIEPAEHAEERKFRLRMAEQQKIFEIHKNKVILYTIVGKMGSIVTAPISILAFSSRPELINFATAALSSCVAGFVGYVTGKAESKSP